MPFKFKWININFCVLRKASDAEELHVELQHVDEIFSWKVTPTVTHIIQKSFTAILCVHSSFTSMLFFKYSSSISRKGTIMTFLKTEILMPPVRDRNCYEKHPEEILRVHCHAIQCFLSIFCGRKWRRGDSRPRRRPMRSRPLPHLFFSSPVPSFAIDRRRRIRQLPLQSSSLGRSWALRCDEESQNKKASVAVNNGENFMESKTGLQSSTDRSWFCLGPKIVQDSRSSRCICVFCHTVQCTLR